MAVNCQRTEPAEGTVQGDTQVCAQRAACVWQGIVPEFCGVTVSEFLSVTVYSELQYTS
jgi:hypothetical protein